MFHQNKFDGQTTKENSGSLTPKFNRYDSRPSVLQYARNSPLITPSRPTFRRYNLADTNLMSSTKYHPFQDNQYHYHSNSPNLSYNNQISTFIDSKSPGYSTRVVQYNEEQERSLPIYQGKYDKLGVFPIVHFFKKDLPSLKRRSSHVNVHMRSSELSKYNTPEHNRMLLEKIIKSGSGSDSGSPHKNEANTKSVLDALKEISRKRIHSNEEEFILKEDGKRMHMDHDNETVSRKRMKQNLSQIEDSPAASCSSGNKFCSMDELIASHSSMDGYHIEKPKKDKIEGRTNRRPKPSPPLKYVDVETQTTVPQPVITPTETVSKIENIEKKNINVNTVEREARPKKPSPVKIFDETPLEAMRRNRLTVLMGTLVQQKTQSEKVDAPEKIEETVVSEKPLVSILAGTNKSPHKNNKHVTFNIPETVHSTETSSGADTFTLNSDGSNLSPKSFNGGDYVTKTSTALVTPIVSASVVELSPLNKTKVDTSSGSAISATEPSPSSSSASAFTYKPSTDIKVPPALSSAGLFFGNKTTSLHNQEVKTSADSKSVQSCVSSGAEKSVTENNTKLSNSTEIPQTNFVFGNAIDKSLNVPSASLPSAKSSSQKGGFKFELKPMHATAEPSTAPANQGFEKSQTDSNRKAFLNPMPASSANTSTFSQFKLPSVSSPKENLTVFPVNSTTVNSATPGTTSLFNENAPKNFSFTTTSVPSINKDQLLNSASKNTSTNFVGVPASLSNNFGQPSNTFQTTNAVVPNFSAKVSTPNFMTSSNLTTQAPLFPFGPNSNVATTFAPSFTSAPPNLFQAAVKSTVANTTSASSIFQPTPSSLPSKSVSSNFNTQSNPTFGTPAPSTFTKPSSGFGSSDSSIFSGTVADTPTNNTPAFGIRTTSSFNTNTSMFTNSTSTPNFTNSGTTKSIFGQGTVPLFGTTTTASFGNNTVPALGANTFAGVTTTSNSIFGSTSGFGVATTSAPSFGTTKDTNFVNRGFGANQNSGFNNNLNNDFKSNPTRPFGAPFGASNNTGSFNANATGFNTTTAGFTPTANFGQANNAFSSTFNTTSPFDKPAGGTNLEMTPFGDTNKSFGNGGFSVNPQVTQGEVFTFGSNNTNKPAVFSFGAGEPPKPTFNFTPENNSNAFGVNNTGFGSSTSAFNSVPTTQFNLQPGAPGMFNIGTGGSFTPNRSRAQHKAKRRT
jgi:nuclear pore complex protein Nup121